MERNIIKASKQRITVGLWRLCITIHIHIVTKMVVVECKLGHSRGLNLKSDCRNIWELSIFFKSISIHFVESISMLLIMTFRRLTQLTLDLDRFERTCINLVRM